MKEIKIKGQFNTIKMTALMLVLGLGFISCQTKAKNSAAAKHYDFSKQASIYEGEDSILVGLHSRKELEIAPYKQWFDENYQDYKINDSLLSELKPLLDGITVKVFMGTWCSDSQYHVPSFFKIMDKADYSYEDFELYSMTEDKVTPENFEQGLNVKQVPTFIIYKDGKELNRIVEYPIVSLEKDLLDILQNKDYKNPYAL